MTDQAPGFDEAQLHFFKIFGYVAMRGLLNPDELEMIECKHREGLAAAFSDEPFKGVSGQWTRMTNEQTLFFASLNEDPRFLTPAQQICGDDVLGNGTDAHFAVGDTQWHSDSGWQPDSEDIQMGVKYHFQLKSQTAQTGALCFIPGSHLLRGSQHRMFGKALEKTPTEEVPYQGVPLQPGDVIVFDIRTWHASFGGAPDRRACNAEYFKNPDTDQGVDFLRNIARLEANSHNARKYTYPKNCLGNPHDSPLRQRWIDHYMEIGFLDQPSVGETISPDFPNRIRRIGDFAFFRR